MPITVGDLKTLPVDDDNLYLYCGRCNAKSSARAGDYWHLPENYIFSCCERSMRLLRREEIEEEIDIEKHGIGSRCKRE